MKSQTDAILEALEAGQQITPMDALKSWGCFRLGARIYELRERGYRIKTEMIYRGRNGYARYSL